MNNKDFVLSEDGKILLQYKGWGEKSVIVPDGVVSINRYAFYDCSRLESIVLPDSVVHIENYAFYGCNSLENIKLSDNVCDIGDDAFGNCRSLKSIEIPNGVRSIGSYAFGDCFDLENIVIPESVTSIGDSAFYGCSSLKSIVIPNKVKSILELTFSGCRNLTNITIGNNVISIGDYAFEHCTDLIKCGKFKAFRISKNNSLYCIDKKYKENKWHYVKGELWLCENGIHYVDNLYEIFNYYSGEIDNDIAIYEIETRGEDIKDLFSSKHCCRSIRLKKRIYREELLKMLSCVKEEKE